MAQVMIPVWDGHCHWDGISEIAVKLEDWGEFRCRFHVVIVRKNQIEDGHWDVECITREQLAEIVRATLQAKQEQCLPSTDNKTLLNLGQGDGV